MTQPKIAVVVYPGSNCEHDAVDGLRAAGAHCELVWHSETTLDGFDAVVLPGGFAHGDYLRPGAIARFSPITGAIAHFAESGRGVLGICNGFQILTEAGLLPGALQKNAGLTFLCMDTELEVTSTASMLTASMPLGSRLSIPINHFSGSYVCSDETLASLRNGDQIVLTYQDNPNGSVGAIAGITNAQGNVIGLMPHPERATKALLGSTDGLGLLESFVETCRARV